MMTVEGRLDRLERSLRRWRTVTIGLVLIMVIGITVAQTMPDEVQFEVRCRNLKVVNFEGETVASLSVTGHGGGALRIANSSGLVTLFTEQNSAGNNILRMSSEMGYSTIVGGVVTIASRKGEGQVSIFNSENGGYVSLTNKTGEEIVQIYADEYGNGVVGAYNRKGKGRTLQPGP